MDDIDASREAALAVARRVNDQALKAAAPDAGAQGDPAPPGQRPPAPPARTYPLKGKL